MRRVDPAVDPVTDLTGPGSVPAAPAAPAAPAVTELAPRTSRRPSVGALAAMTVTVLAWASAFVGIRGVGRAYEPGRAGSSAVRNGYR